MPTAKNTSPLEEYEQTRLSTWLTQNAIRHVASMNAGKRSFNAARRLKATGLATGFPDIFIPLPSGGYHGLMIELKRAKGGKPTPEQIGWIQYLRDNGYWADIAHGFEEARDIVIHYLALTSHAA